MYLKIIDGKIQIEPIKQELLDTDIVSELRVIGGELEVAIVEPKLDIETIKKLLKKAGKSKEIPEDKEETDAILHAGKPRRGDQYLGKLGKKTKMPI